MRYLRFLSLSLLIVLLSSSAAYALFSHSRSVKTVDTFSGMSVQMSTTGLELDGGADCHEMSLTMYAPGEYSHGATEQPTWAIAIGRNNGYDSYPADNLDDGKLHAYTLSTYAKADAENNHDFLYLGGREQPLEMETKRDYRVTLEWTGFRRWVYDDDPAHPVNRGYCADWDDGQGHWAYHWVAKIDGVEFADCWFNSPKARIKFESNKVRAPRVKSVNHFRNLRVRREVTDRYTPMPPSIAFPIDSNNGYYTSYAKPWFDVYFMMGATTLAAKASNTKPPHGSSVTIRGTLTDTADGRALSLPMSLCSSSDGGRTWSVESTGTTTSRGTISRIVRPLAKRKYKWVSAGDESTYYGRSSAIMTVVPQEVATIDAVADKTPVNRYLTIRTGLLPRHESGGTMVFYAQHWESGKWVQKTGGKMIVSADGTTFRTTVKPTAKGSWRFRAYHTHPGKPRLFTKYERTTVY